MSEQSVGEIADKLGLNIEVSIVPEHKHALKVYKGVNQLFIGTEDAVREFLVSYEKDRPGLFEGSIFGYKE